jgi:hypothetical protein
MALLQDQHRLLHQQDRTRYRHTASLHIASPLSNSFQIPCSTMFPRSSHFVDHLTLSAFARAHTCIRSTLFLPPSSTRIASQMANKIKHLRPLLQPYIAITRPRALLFSFSFYPSCLHFPRQEKQVLRCGWGCDHSTAVA